MRKTIIAIAITIVVILTGCSSDGGGPTITDNPPDTSQSPDVGTEGKAGDESPPDTYGGTKTAKFGQTITAEMGSKVSVTKVRRASGGIIATIKVTNGTEDPLDGYDFDVEASYGKDGVQADCCLDAMTDDSFSGKILPGRTKTATWGFEVPSRGLSDVVIEISYGFGDQVFIFEGAVK
jgi:hypothetical protein